MKRSALAALLASFLITIPVSGQSSERLVVGNPVEREIAGEEIQVFELMLDENQFVFGEADQISVDVVVTVKTPEGVIMEVFDSPARGAELFQFRNERAGLFTIEITPFEEQSGSYVMHLHRVEPVASTPEARVNQIMTSFDRVGSPGAAVIAIKNGEIIFADGYGYANLEYDVPISTETVFYIGSVGKQFTSFAIVLLAERGKLSLDDDIRKHLPELNDFGSTVTIRNLIHQTSGMRDYFGLLTHSGTRSGDLVTQEHILDVIYGQRELNFEPGSKYLYSNSNYALLATIVERVSGESFGDWMDTNVFDPLGMENTRVGDDHEEIIKHRAASYALAANGEYATQVFPYSGYGAGGIYSSADDLVLWLRNFESPVVGSTASHAQMVERGVLTTGDTLNYAFGLSISNYKGLRRVGHGGALAGYRSYVGRFPDQNFGIIVLSNLATSGPQGLAMEITDAYLSDQFIRPSGEEESQEATSSSNEEIDFDPTLFDDFAGRYELRPSFILTFWREENRLFTQATGQGQLEIFASSDSTFFLKVVEASLTFHRNPNGSVTGLTLHQGGDSYGPRLSDEPYDPSPADLAEYAGQYFSNEMDASYTLSVSDGKLTASHRRHGDSVLNPLTPDNFSGPGSLAEIVFQRDINGRIVSFRVSDGRIKNLLFERRE